MWVTKLNTGNWKPLGQVGTDKTDNTWNVFISTKSKEKENTCRVSAWCKRDENKAFSLKDCCGGECPCPGEGARGQRGTKWWGNKGKGETEEAGGEGDMGKRGEAIDAIKPKPFCHVLCWVSAIDLAAVVDRPTQLFYIWIFICCKYTNLKDTERQSAIAAVARKPKHVYCVVI